MSQALPNPSDLQYFIEVSHCENLSRAAERLGISQPSLSLAMQRLEDNVGTRLLNRSKRGVQLTRAGKKLLVHSQELLQKWEEVKSGALASDQLVQGTYSIGCHPSVAQYTLPLFVKGLLIKHPKLDIQLHHDLSRKVAEKVIRMDLDVGIVVNPVQHPDLVIKKITEDVVTFWVHKKPSRLQNPKDGEAVLIMDPELTQSQTLLKKIHKQGLKFSRTLNSSNLEVVTKLVHSGAGIGLIPGKVVEHSHLKGLIQLPNSPKFNDEICVIYRAENRHNQSIQALVKRIHQLFE